MKMYLWLSAVALYTNFLKSSDNFFRRNNFLLERVIERRSVTHTHNDQKTREVSLPGNTEMQKKNLQISFGSSYSEVFLDPKKVIEQFKKQNKIRRINGMRKLSDETNTSNDD